MNCDITKGRNETCKDSAGGLFFAYLFNWSEKVIPTFNSLGQITNLTTVSGGVPTCYGFELKGSNNFEETVNSSRENGTTFWQQVINMTLKKLDADTRNEVKKMAWGNPQIVLVDNNGNTLMFGLDRGCEVTGGTIVSGVNLGDMSGYTLAFTGEEPQPANFLYGATKLDPFGGLTGSVDIVLGGDAATYTVGAGIACDGLNVVGTYAVGVALDNTNYIEIDVDVLSVGSWSMDTDTQSDIRFSGSGTFTEIGTQTVTLYGSGSPFDSGAKSLTVASNDLGGSGNCTAEVTVT